MESRAVKETIKRIELEENLKNAVNKIKGGILEYESAMVDYEDFGIDEPRGSLTLSKLLFMVLSQSNSLDYK